MHLKITFGNELSQRAFSDSSCLRQLSCGQLVEQSLSLLQIERVEAFGKPAVDRGEKIASLIPLALIAPKPRHAHCCAQPPRRRWLSIPIQRTGISRWAGQNIRWDAANSPLHISNRPSP